MFTITVASCRHQGQPAFCAAWSTGQAVSHSAAAATALAAYRIAAARRQVRSARATTWGSFRQRTIDRRYCGLIASASCVALSGLQSPFDPYGLAAKARLAGGRPSSAVWSW